MNCPVCDGRMRAVEKYGVEVDICPDCKGVWLDRGELDKILDMVESGGPAPAGDVTRPRESRQEDRPREEYREQRGEERPREERRDDRYHDERDRESERDKGHEKRYDDRGREIDSRAGKPKRRGSWFGEIFESFGGGDD